MGDFTAALNNFTGGKVSEKFKGRFDLQIYRNSLEEFKNFNMGKIGGAYKRTGTVKIGRVSDALGIDEDYTSIPFDSGLGSPWIIYIPNNSINLNSTKRVFATRTTPPTASYSLNYRTLAIAPTWPVTDGTAFSGGKWVYQQVGDRMFITHSSGEQKPLVLSKVGTSEVFFLEYYDESSIGLSNQSYTLKAPYYPSNLTSTTMTVGSGSITASSAYFTAGMVGARMKIVNGTNTESFVITGFTSTTVVTATTLIGTGTISATDNWQIQAWCDEFSWPSAVTFHNRRLYWGGGKFENIDTIWATQVGNLFRLMMNRLIQDLGSSTDVSGVNYFGDITPSDPTDFKPASSSANALKWLSGGRTLMCGTTGGENIINHGSDSIEILENSSYGSTDGMVVKAGKDVIFIGKNKRSIRTYRYSDENGSWVSDDLSSKADEIFFDGAVGSGSVPFIRQVAWNPDTKEVWVVLSNGEVKVLSYDPEYGLMGWSEFEIGGGSVKSVIGVCCLPNNTRSRYDTFLTVNRDYTGGGTNRIYLEAIQGVYSNTTISSYSSTDIQDFPRFVDMAVLATASAAGIVTVNVIYLAQQFTCFYINSDGTFGYIDNVEVVNNGGSIELDHTFGNATKVIYGYKYTAELTTLPLDAGGVLGTAISDIKDISRVYLKMYRTLNFKIGSKDQRSGLDLGFEEVTYDDLVTEEKEIMLFDNPDSDGSVIVRSDKPYPLNILAMILKGDSKR